MAKNLVVVESPTKAKSIKSFLGKDYEVLASVGHVRDLPKSRLGVDIEDNFEPEYINIRGKAPVINEIKDAAKKADNVYLATDSDREGEAISWHLAYLLDMDEDSENRISFNEITQRAVKDALEHPRAIDKNLVDAQQGRRVLDRLVGYSISPILWKKVRGGLSAGRVQSAVVKSIADREQEIEDFIPEEYWSLKAELKINDEEFVADYYGRMVDDKEEKIDLPNEETVKEIIDSLDKDKFVVEEVETGNRTRNSRPPYTTSTMQQEASRFMSFTGRKTMSVAQSLYEGVRIGGETTGLITYMRTDSTNVSEEARKAAYGYIVDNYGKEYANTSRKYGSSKSAQEAHECIRPTNIFNTPTKIKEYLKDDQYRLYRMIWQRFMASMMSAAKYETIRASIHSNDQVFRANGSRLIFDGFLALKRNEDKDDPDTMLPKLKVKDEPKLEELIDTQHFTRPPARFSEATMVRELEKLGIGRPSTYAPTISTILTRNYVEIIDRRFHITDLGRTVNDLLVEYFPSVTDAEFTAVLEDKLDEIAEGHEPWKQVVGDFYTGFEKNLKTAEEEIEKVELEEEVTDEICEKCGKNMIIKHGRYGKFLACPGYPECKNTKPLLDKVGVKCNKCEDGEIIRRRSKRGRTFYGCSSYPDCDFISWNEPVQIECEECGSLMTKPNGKNAKNLICSNQECKHEMTMPENLKK